MKKRPSNNSVYTNQHSGTDMKRFSIFVQQIYMNKLICIFFAHTFVTTIFPASTVIKLTPARPCHTVGLYNKGVRNFSFFSREPKPTVKIAEQNIPDWLVDKNIHLPVRKLKDLRGFDALVGKIPEQVKECAEMFKLFKAYEEMGARIPKGLLMVGPPGTGKTSIAKVIAQEANVYCYFTAATEFNDKWYGTSEQNIRNAFAQCRNAVKESNNPAILFIDEIDAIGSRTTSGSSGGADKRVLSELLSQMDGCVPNVDSLFATDVFVMGATNCADLLDPALKRPGRFDKIIEIPLPDTESIQALLMHYLSFTKYDMESISYKFVEEIAINIAGISPADIRHIINECAILAVRSKSPAINKLHIEEAFNRFKERNQNTMRGLNNTSVC